MSNQGKIISFTPKMNGNVQDTYNGKNGLLYKFTMVINFNGQDITGTVNSNKQQPSWKVGEEYFFEMTTNGNFTNFSALKAVNGGSFGGAGGSKKSSPEFTIQKLFEGAYKVTYSFFQSNKELYSAEAEGMLVDKVYKWITDVPEENKRWIRLVSLEIISKKIEINGMFDLKEGEKKTAYLFRKALELSQVMETTIKAQIDYDNANKSKSN